MASYAKLRTSDTAPGNIAINMASAVSPRSKGDPLPEGESLEGAAHKVPTSLVAALRQDMADWACVVLLGVLATTLALLTPRRAYLATAVLPALSCPFNQHSTFPSWTVPVIAIALPAVVIWAVLPLTARRWSSNMGGSSQKPAGPAWRSAYRHTLGLLTAVFLAGAITNCLKPAVGRLRPNYVDRCWPDGATPAFVAKDAYGGFPSCSGPEEWDVEGRRSFPSGHTSWSAAGLLYLSAVLAAHTGLWGSATAAQPARLWCLLLSALPTLLALAVGTSRVIDCHHHSSDVLAGAALGAACAAAAYRQLSGCSLGVETAGRKDISLASSFP